VIVAELDRAAADEVQGEAGRRARAVANLAAPALDGARLLELVQHQAHHDPLTGLPNARLIGDRLEVAVAQARRSGSPVALLFVDLDGFKEVNDQLGHGAGDAVLREVASRLLQTVREADTVARLGGDEFVVLLPALRGPEDAEVARRRVGDVLASVPAVVGEEVVALRASIGLASFPEDGETASDLLHRADIAMYRAKVSHRAARAS
jgi:diguanylate cyclase (GGDEF)-like protein